MWRTIVTISLGAAIGANLRYFVVVWAGRSFGLGFPYGTLFVNLIGCIVIGILLSLSERLALGPQLRLLLVTGLLGSFTTFSSFAYEAYGLIMSGRWPIALLYVGASVILGMLGVVLGAGLARLAG